MIDRDSLPTGKLPVSLLKDLLGCLPPAGPEVILGPGIGLDCAIVQSSGQMLVLKTDPITFASDSIGWYAVQINVNDILTTGAVPRWMLTTLLLPEKDARLLARQISTDLSQACQEMGIAIVGGHTEITKGLDRPIVVGTIIGEVEQDQWITPKGARSGDLLLLTKRVPIEMIAILGRDAPEILLQPPVSLSKAELIAARDFLYHPGISIQKDVQAARSVSGIHAMHDPTEGGLYSALWELADACGHNLMVESTNFPIYPLAEKICQGMGLDPFAAISSGSLLIAASDEKASNICLAIRQAGIECTTIGRVEEPSISPCVVNISIPGFPPLPRPDRDQISKIFNNQAERRV